MKEKIKKEVSGLTVEETKKVFDRISGIFKGGVEITNIEDMNRAMVEYYKSLSGKWSIFFYYSLKI